MAMIGGGWKEEPTPEEQYEEITGRKFHGTRRELEKEIEKGIDDGWTSKTERNQLRDLQSKIDSEK